MDIVERLRDWADQMRVGETNLTAAHLVPSDLREAAHEIERLRGPVAQLGTQAGVGHPKSDELDQVVANVTKNVIRRLEAKNDMLTAECERLRRQLQSTGTAVRALEEK